MRRKQKHYDMAHITTLAIMVTGLMAASCSSQGDTISKPTHYAGTDMIGNAQARPAAIVYSTNNDYRHNVAVTLNDAGTLIMSYPDPADVRRTDPTPIDLGDGYLLDRRGISPNTAFLDITYDEYASLDSTPTADELLRHVVARSPFAEMYALPISASKAAANPELCHEYIANGFKDCTGLITTSRLKLHKRE